MAINHDVRKDAMNRQALLPYSTVGRLSAQIAHICTQPDADRIAQRARETLELLNSNIVYAPERLVAGSRFMLAGGSVLALAVACAISLWLQREVSLVWACVIGGLAVVACAFFRVGASIRFGDYLPVVVQPEDIAKAIALRHEIGEDTAPHKPAWVEPVTLFGHVIEVSLIMLLVFEALATFLPFWAAVVIAFVLGGIAAPILLEVSRRTASYLATLHKVRVRYRNLCDVGASEAAERLREHVGSRVIDKFSAVTIGDYAYPIAVVSVFVGAIVAVCVLRVLMGDAEVSAALLVSSTLLGFVTVVIFLGTIALHYGFSSLAGARGEEASRLLAHWPTEQAFRDDMICRRLANENMTRACLADIQRIYACMCAKRDPKLASVGLHFELPPQQELMGAATAPSASASAQVAPIILDSAAKAAAPINKAQVFGTHSHA